MSGKKQPLLERFMKKVNKTDSCWLWTASLHRNKYGKFGMNGKTCLAHRISWLLHHGELPTLLVLHRCDNPLCVNPDHLFIGTNQDNANDKVKKNRQPKGYTRAGWRKVTDQQVIEIRSAVGTQASIGAQFGISKTQVRNIKARKCHTRI